jgi:hypothetical protein
MVSRIHKRRGGLIGDVREESTLGIIRHMISKVDWDTTVIVVAQDCSRWLSTLFALRIQHIIIFAPLTHQRWYLMEEGASYDCRSIRAFSESDLSMS